MQEEVVVRGGKAEEGKRVWKDSKRAGEVRPVKIDEISQGRAMRLILSNAEFNRTLGGGMVPGSLVLIGGQPGIGKSTLLLQVALESDETVLYVSGEESEEQIKMRADRLGIKNSKCFVFTETETQRILAIAGELRPGMIVIDSIQTIHTSYIDSSAGSVSQVKECTAELQRFAKEMNIPIVIIGHINKEGAIAGPKLLEHMVDVVLQFEGDRHYTYRILRTVKNRFGSTDEIGLFEMLSTGLREVSNPSELLLSQHEEGLSGSSIGATLEGMRPMLIETQALVSRAVYGNPQRSATGFDLRRLSMLLAVLEKRCGFPFAQHDVFLNIAGGLKVNDPAIDLSIISALISSLEDVSVVPTYCFAGEVGLSGEIRAVNKVEQRIQEAERLGFERIFISKYNLKGIQNDNYRIIISTIGKVEELYQELFV